MPVDTASPVSTRVTEAAPTQAAGGGGRTRSAAPLVRRLQSWAPVVILVVLCGAFGALDSQFLTAENLKTIANQSAIPLVLVAGLTFVIVQGSIDLSLEGVMAVSSIGAALLIANDVNGNDLGYLGVLVGVVSGLIFGVFNGVLYTKLRVPSLLVTLGTWFVGLGIAALLYPSRQPRIQDLAIREWSLGEWLGLSRLVFVALACLLVAYVVQRYTRLGRHSYAIGGGEDIARLSGLRLDRYKIGVFAFAGLMAGLAGVMATTRLGVGSVEAGDGTLFPAIAAVVIGGTLLSGGRGGVLHSLVGVLTLTALTNGMVLVGIDPYIQQAVQGGIIVVAVVATTWHQRDRLRVVK